MKNFISTSMEAILAMILIIVMSYEDAKQEANTQTEQSETEISRVF